MPSKRGGYGSNSGIPEWEQDASAGITSKIICVRCSKVKSKSNFSNAKLLELKKKTKGRRTVNLETQPFVSCRTCLGSAKSEMKCGTCEQTKDLSSFAKSQRSKGDEDAECIACVTNRLSDTPYDPSGKTDEEDEQSYDLDQDDLTNSSSVAQGGVSISQGMETLSVREDGSSSSLTGPPSVSDESSQSGPSTQTQWVAQRGRGLVGGAHAVLSASGTSQNSFNRSHYGEPSRSTADMSSATGQSKAKNVTVNKSGFAQAKASKPSTDQNEPPPGLYEQLDRNTGNSGSEDEFDGI